MSSNIIIKNESKNMPNSNFKCPKCGSKVLFSGNVLCWCDKDFCSGQRCGADKLYRDYTCQNENCKHTATPPETENYYYRHRPKD